MSGSGHVFDMINRMKSNRRSRKKDGFKANNRDTSFDYKNKKTEYKTVSDIQLRVIKQKIKIKARKDYQYFVIRYILILLFIAMVCYFLFY